MKLQSPSSQPAPVRLRGQRITIGLKDDYTARIDVWHIRPCSSVAGLKEIKHSQSLRQTACDPQVQLANRLLDCIRESLELPLEFFPYPPQDIGQLVLGSVECQSA